MASRDWDCLDDARARLLATGAFDSVYASALPETRGRAAADTAAAVVAPREFEEEDEADEAGGPLVLRTVRWMLTLIVRDDEPSARERTLDLLYATAANALDGQSLAGLTVPGWTKLRRGRYETPAPPEQRLTCQGEFRYWLEGFAGRDTSP